jgi:hypothetical protein
LPTLPFRTVCLPTSLFFFREKTFQLMKG